MMAAITAARGGAAVTVYERNDRPGKKILATGNGKCNLGNEEMSPENYQGGNRALVASCLDRFGTEDMERFFASLGLMLKSRDGYLYPACEQAAVVLDVLRFALEDFGVELVLQTRVTHIRRTGEGRLRVIWEGGERDFDRVIIACGGKAAPRSGSDGSGYRLAGELGLACREVVPALTALHCREDYCKAIAGVRAQARITILEGEHGLTVDGKQGLSGKEANGLLEEGGHRLPGREGHGLLEEEGELQLVDYGISGIPVFQLSGRVNYLLREGKTLRASIDFLPQMSREEYQDFVRKRMVPLKELRERSLTVERFFTGMLHKKLMALFIRLAGLKAGAPVGEADPARVKEVFRLCRDFSLQITGSNSFDQAQVCAGGVKLDEVDENLEAWKAPGVFLAGEVLDVDGRCGGYNLHWAWCSGYIAGSAAAGAETEKTGKRQAGRLDAAGGRGRKTGKSGHKR